MNRQIIIKYNIQQNTQLYNINQQIAPFLN